MSHFPNNYTLFEYALESPFEIEINKSSFSCKFKGPGFLFFWLDKENVIEDTSRKIKILKMEKNIRIGISLAPLIWFDDEHPIFGWVCSPKDTLIAFLSALNSEKPQLQLGFSLDKDTVI